MKWMFLVAAICLAGLMTACGGVGNIGNPDRGATPEAAVRLPALVAMTQ